MRFEKNKPHDLNKMALHVTLQCETLEFVEISHYVKLVRCTSFFRTPSLKFTWWMWGVSRHACSEIKMCHDGKGISLKLTNTPMIGGAKLNLVSRDEMTNEHIVVVGWLEQLQWTYGEARKDVPPPNHIRGMLARYKDILTNRLHKNYRQGVENNFAQQEIEFISYVVTNEVGGWTWWRSR
jgi:hypothetical protein